MPKYVNGKCDTSNICIPDNVKRLLDHLQQQGIIVDDVVYVTPENGVNEFRSWNGGSHRNNKEPVKENKEQKSEHKCQYSSNNNENIEILLSNINYTLDLMNKNIMVCIQSIKNLDDTINKCSNVPELEPIESSIDIRKEIADEVAIQFNAAYNEKLQDLTDKYEKIIENYEKQISSMKSNSKKKSNNKELKQH